MSVQKTPMALLILFLCCQLKLSYSSERYIEEQAELHKPWPPITFLENFGSSLEIQELLCL